MRPNFKELEPINVDPAQWRRRVIDVAFESMDGREIRYDGDAFVSESLQTHTIEFEFKTHPFSPANIQMPLSVSAPASVRVRVNDQLVATLELGTSKEDAVPHIL